MWAGAAKGSRPTVVLGVFACFAAIARKRDTTSTAVPGGREGREDGEDGLLATDP